MKITVNDFFDKVYVINLDRRADRLDTISNSLNSLGIAFEKFKAVDGIESGLSGIQGCATSHRNVIQDAISNGYENILVLEDDALFLNGFAEEFSKHINRIPDNWDMVYLGASGIRKESDTRGLVKILDCNSSHAIGISKSIFQELINVNDLETHIDSSYSTLHEFHNVYAIDPAIVIQSPGYSDVVNIKYDPSKYFIVD